MSLKSTVRLMCIAAAATLAGVLTLQTAFAKGPQTTGSLRSKIATPQGESDATASGKITLREPIPYSTLRKATSQLRSGTSRTTKKGVNGEKEVVYHVFSRPDGSELRREKLSEKVTKKSISEVREEGSLKSLPSRGYFSGRRTVTMIATSYRPVPSEGGSSTKTGIRAHYGVVAVDPRFIPLGTRLYIEGYGYAVAADTGSAIKGNRIDLCIDSAHQAHEIDGHTPVKVHILD